MYYQPFVDLVATGISVFFSLYVAHTIIDFVRELLHRHIDGY